MTDRSLYARTIVRLFLLARVIEITCVKITKVDTLLAMRIGILTRFREWERAVRARLSRSASACAQLRQRAVCKKI
jgi:hypothetical protein